MKHDTRGQVNVTRDTSGCLTDPIKRTSKGPEAVNNPIKFLPASRAEVTSKDSRIFPGLR